MHNVVPSKDEGLDLAYKNQGMCQIGGGNVPDDRLRPMDYFWFFDG